jgi:hypothetical protein
MPVSRVCGTTVVLPSDDTNTPDVPVSAEALYVAESFLSEIGVPRRVKFTPSQLAEDVGGSKRGWQRECELGNIGAARLVGGWVVPWSRLVAYVAVRQNIVESDN